MRKLTIQIIVLIVLAASLCYAVGYSTINYMAQGGKAWVIGNGGTLTVKSGGTLTLDSGSTLANTATTTVSGTSNVASGGTVRVLSGGTLQVDSGATFTVAGASCGGFAYKLSQNTTEYTGVTTESNAFSKTIPAATVVAGTALRLRCGGVITGTTSTKTFKVKKGTTTILTVPFLSTNSGAWTMSATIFDYTDAAHQKIIADTSIAAGTVVAPQYVTSTADFTAASTVLTTVTVTSSSDALKQESCLFEFLP